MKLKFMADVRQSESFVASLSRREKNNFNQTTYKTGNVRTKSTVQYKKDTEEKYKHITFVFAPNFHELNCIWWHGG